MDAIRELNKGHELVCHYWIDRISALALWDEGARDVTSWGCSHANDTHLGCKFCNAIVQAIGRIAAEENAKLFVPVSIAQYSVYEALAAELLAR